MTTMKAIDNNNNLKIPTNKEAAYCNGFEEGFKKGELVGFDKGFIEGLQSCWRDCNEVIRQLKAGIGGWREKVQ